MVDRSDNAVPEFFMHPVENKQKSKEAGRKIFEEKEMVRIRIPGQRDTWEGEVDDRLRTRFPKQYDAFKKGEELAKEGTPLEMWPPMTRSRVAEMKAQGVTTVEELAGVPDNALPNLGMGAREERAQAIAWIDNAKGSADVERMAAEIETLKQMLAAKGQPDAVKPEPLAEKDIEDCTDQELKEFIKRETGKGVPGNPSRDTLVERAREIAS